MSRRARLGPCPSELDGLSREQVVAMKRTAINTVIEAGSRLQMDTLATSAACVFLHRFYETKSLVRNDPFLMSMACLYLGGKVENSPKSVRDVLMASCELRYPADARRLHQRDFYERLRDKVFIAERSLLYALDFRFDASLPFKTFLSVLVAKEPLKSYRARLAERDQRRAAQVAQFGFNLVIDSLKTEACLAYSGHEIAVACIWLSLKLFKEDTHVLNDQGQLWWVGEGVSEEALEGVELLLQDVYSQDVFALYSHDLVLQSATQIRRPARPAHQQQQPPQPQPQPQPSGALPPEVAAANRLSWEVAAAAAPPAVKQEQQAVMQEQPHVKQEQQEQPHVKQEQQEPQEPQEEDYDDLLGFSP